jgi:hypothetical protein
MPEQQGVSIMELLLRGETGLSPSSAEVINQKHQLRP